MAGPQDIQRYPRGLIDLFGMRGTGDTPHTLSASISGQVDLTDLYLADRSEAQVFNAAAVVAALGPILFSGATVPQGEMWLVYEAGVFSGTAAAATGATLVPFIARSQNGTLNVPIIPPITVPASSQGMGGVHYERPTVAMPGQQWGIQVTSITGLPLITPSLVLYFARLRV